MTLKLLSLIYAAILLTIMTDRSGTVITENMAENNTETNDSGRISSFHPYPVFVYRGIPLVLVIIAQPI